MAPYVPSDEPQKHGVYKRSFQSRWHEDEFKAHGPLPPNYSVERPGAVGGPVAKKAARYTELSSASSRVARFHPLSPAGLNSVPNPIVHDEQDLNRPASPFVFDAPIKYKAGTKMRWLHSDTPQAALTMALVSHGFKCKTDRTRPVDEADVRATFDSITPQEAAEPRNSALFYPADRGSIVFPEEPDVAIVARKYGCSLIVICPFMRADKMGYNHFYNIKNRPPMYARWSTGQQAQAMPLVLGCLPMYKFNTSPSYEAMWFFIEANSIDPPDWYNGFYTQFNLGSLADNLGFPFADLSPQTFLWTLVYLHRQRMTGLAVSDDHLGCWIYHFGWHLSVEGKRVNKYSDLLPFNYDNAWLSNYQRKHPNAKLTFDRLTQLTLNPNMNANGISIGQYARLWDEAFSARIQYQQDQTQAKWVVFKTKMEAATKLPHLWNS